MTGAGNVEVEEARLVDDALNECRASVVLQAELVPVQYPEHVVVADSIPIVIPSKLLLVSDVRHLEKFYRPAVSLGAGIRNYISCSRSISGSQSTRS